MPSNVVGDDLPDISSIDLKKEHGLFMYRVRCLTAFLTAIGIGGCSTLVAYAPQQAGADQTLKYTQGVGALSIRDSDHEVYIYPAFKTQGTSQPTFTIGYANNTSTPQNFGTGNIRAFFRGSPVPIYTYTEKIEEIQNEKTGKQVALAILGGIAAGTAAYSASHQTYTSSYRGAVWSRTGAIGFAGSNTLRVYDPASGMLAGAAVGGATAIGVRQLDFNAQNQEFAANEILQQNTVDPQRMVTGNLILKNCCDPYLSPSDTITIEVTTAGKVDVFTFFRTKNGVAPPTQQVATAIPSTTAVSMPPRTSPVNVQTPSPVSTMAPPPPAAPPIAPRTANVPAASAKASLPQGRDEFEVQRVAKSEACSPTPAPLLTAKGAGFETYVVTCSNGDAVSYRCEMGNCRSLK